MVVGPVVRPQPARMPFVRGQQCLQLDKNDVQGYHSHLIPKQNYHAARKVVWKTVSKRFGVPNRKAKPRLFHALYL